MPDHIETLRDAALAFSHKPSQTNLHALIKAAAQCAEAERQKDACLDDCRREPTSVYPPALSFAASTNVQESPAE